MARLFLVSWYHSNEMDTTTNHNHALYEAFKAKDARFDGRFFVGISSTGIYCRPVCRAKQPKEENCTFYATAAEAEQVGYRPCLLCRPELAPGSSVTDSTANLTRRAIRILEQNCDSGWNLDQLAGQLGCTSRHLRRVFTAQYHVSPVQYLQTCRLLLAKNLLTDTNLSVLDVAMASGFGSLRRFNDLFKRHYRLSPLALRKEGSKDNRPSDGITLALGYRPPYRWEHMLAFLSERAISGIETIKNDQYSRTVGLFTAERKHVQGWIRVKHHPEKNALAVTMSENLLPVIPLVLARVRHLFDLNCDPNTIYRTLISMNKIRPGLCMEGIRLPGCFNTFEMAVRAILGQQISVKAAGTLAARIVSAYGTPVWTGIAGLTHLFPTPQEILALGGAIENALGSLGVTSAKSRAIYDLGLALANKQINLNLFAQPEEEMKKLTSIRGIGNWTARYIAMRAMGWPDVFLETDLGVKKALKTHTTQELLVLAESWRPWRSYATINLWNTL